MQYGSCVVVGGMSDGRDPAVKLFGRKIPLSEEQQPADKEVVAEWSSLTKGEKDSSEEKEDIEVNAMLDGLEELSQIELLHSGVSNCIEDEQKTSTDTTKYAEVPKPEQDNKGMHTTCEDVVLKKPDKILHCPRCNSMDTKFCYYNNYNVNQPRYFCKNCQRYWTSGGTMRNVPVGAGRRKNKHSALTFRHTVQVDEPDLTRNQAPFCGSNASKKAYSKVNDSLLKFEAEDLHCESTASVVSVEEQKKAEEPSCSSSLTALKHAENDFSEDSEQNIFPGYQNGVAPLHHLQYFPVPPPWAYAWNPGWSDVAPISWSQLPMVIAPAFCSPIPFPFIPASFWGCVPNWAGVPWDLPLVGSDNGLMPSSSSIGTNKCLGHASVLGKHCRDAASSTVDGKPEKSLWVPKTSRVDDIDEASRSSIFAILGIKPDEGGLSKAFPSNINKGEAALHANPAALSRSQAFQETTN